MEIKVVLSASPELESLLTRIADVLANPVFAAGEIDGQTSEKPRRSRKPKAEQVVADATAAAAEASAEVTAAVATQAAAAAAPVTVAAAPAAPAAPAADPAGGAGGLNYETDVRPKIIAALGNPEIGQARVLPVIQAFGVSNAKDIPPSRWGELLAQIAALSAPSFA